jgi:hypothetical protein
MASLKFGADFPSSSTSGADFCSPTTKNNNRHRDSTPKNNNNQKQFPFSFFPHEIQPKIKIRLTQSSKRVQKGRKSGRSDSIFHGSLVGDPKKIRPGAELDAFISVTDDKNELLRVAAAESCGRWASCHLLKHQKRKEKKRVRHRETRKKKRELKERGFFFFFF